jgi:hypothetical protein
MKRRNKGFQLLGIVSLCLTLLLLFPTGLFANDTGVKTTVSLAEQPPAVTYSSLNDVLDASVYDALSIQIVDPDFNKLDFIKDDITLEYDRKVGKQSIKVNYKGNDTYQASTATTTLIITDAPKTDTRLVLMANPASVSYTSDAATLDKEVYADLNIVVVDNDSNKIDFSPSDITLNYTRAIATQPVTVTYGGNSKYNNTQAKATVEITGLQDTSISLESEPNAIKYTDDSAALDQLVYNALSIVVIDANSNKIPFASSDIQLSYNRDIGTQDITVKYLGNDQYATSTATQNLVIKGKTDTSVVLSSTPVSVKYTTDATTMNAEIEKALTIQIIDSNKNNIDFTKDDLELSYNQAPGDQPITVKYKGNDQYNASKATQTVAITNLQKSSIILTANPPSIEFNGNTDDLDTDVYTDLCIDLVNDNNEKIPFTKNDITLDYSKKVGKQKVTVTYKGNDTYNSSVATTQIKIVDQEENKTSLSTLAIVGIVLGCLIILGIIGLIVYKKKHNNNEN